MADFVGHPHPAAPDFSTGKRLTRFSGRYRSPTAQLSPTHDILCVTAFLQPLLSLTHWIFGSLMLPYKSSSRSAKYVRWCDSCSLATPMQRAELNTARQSSHKSPARDDSAGGPPIVNFDQAKRSGEISPSDGTGGITVGDLSAQSIMGAFSICPIPTCISARDDDVGGHPSRHFDRSVAEWRNLLPLMVRAALRQEISRLRVSSERFPSVFHTGMYLRSR